ncbi:MAG: cation:proton antiporter [Candidatus Accumulibacter sp.]|uniref:cation:proton antiporter n=1 Tax=Accumulibacter sp. TaxID=2053492 RepID=UPI001AC3EE50|nr:cation:proton antiporter [Accumulibacter sp.]MBN8438083.1 cation:proton antiporter [Accumulibacter sp.]
MSSAQWFLLVGGLLLSMGLSRPTLGHLPVTSAIIYLLVGLVVGPTVLNVFHFNPLKQSGLLEVLTEAAVLISLYAAGVKMPVPVRRQRWRTPILLAVLSMTVTVGLVTAFAHYLLGLPLGAAVLLGAIVAPTDPVLATDVQIRHPGDRDQLRFTLTCEAGMNDGTAFPLVMLGLGLLGLHELGDLGLRWVLVDVLWATAAGIIVGVLCGVTLAHLGKRLRVEGNEHQLMDDFLGLGLIGVVYGLCLLLSAWGFLAVFFAAVALRQTEQRLANVAEPVESADALCGAPPSVSAGSLVFKEHLERLSEVLLILLIGGSLFLDSWSWRAVGLAAFLFAVARPLSVLVGLLGSGNSWRICGLAGWFGVRGIGSLYYLMYAIEHGLPEEIALELIHMTLIVVTLSILVHGISVKPLMDRFWSRRGRSH